ncbi:unnamed protein product [Prorocentrum cordatum]|uniref:Uncharacterized protein n=1 Tax=Prorocentrum cordatum TaxID=2364126 RepID=A0ABN9WRC3_9DINO|nr:unnamed protein product [Polarella glacialis]
MLASRSPLRIWPSVRRTTVARAPNRLLARPCRSWRASSGAGGAFAPDCTSPSRSPWQNLEAIVHDGAVASGGAPRRRRGQATSTRGCRGDAGKHRADAPRGAEGGVGPTRQRRTRRSGARAASALRSDGEQHKQHRNNHDQSPADSIRLGHSSSQIDPRGPGGPNPGRNRPSRKNCSARVSGPGRFPKERPRHTLSKLRLERQKLMFMRFLLFDSKARLLH